jgi:hypothetical protein
MSKFPPGDDVDLLEAVLQVHSRAVLVDYRNGQCRGIVGYISSFKGQALRPIIAAHVTDEFRSSDMKHSYPEQIEPGSPVHLTFDKFEPRNLPLHLPLTPR